MFTIDDFRIRYLKRLESCGVLKHWCAPKNGFDDVQVHVSPEEFHDLCTQDSDIYTAHRVHGVVLQVTPNA